MDKPHGTSPPASHKDATPGSPVPTRWHRRRGNRQMLPIVLILLCAAFVRIVYLIETAGVPYVRHFIGDGAAYYGWARTIADGNWLGQESFYQAPLYPYLLAICFSLLGDEVWTIRTIQAIGGCAAVWCLWYGISRTFDRRTGIISAGMLALYGPAVFFDGLVQKASLACLLTCALLAAMAGHGVRRNTWRAGLVGVLGALLVLTRENAAVWLPLVGLWVWNAAKGERRRERVCFIGAYFLGVALVLTPVGVRNKRVAGEWSLSTFQSGPNFYIGNNKKADGRYQPLVRGHETPAFERGDAEWLAERDLGRKLSSSEVSRYWWSRAMADIRADRTRWFALMGRKLLMVWNRYEVADAESQYVYADYSVTLHVLGSVWHFGVLCPLAAVGVIATSRDWRRLWIYYALIVSMALAVALFYVMARYRYPLVPLLIPFAAAGGLELWRLIRAREFRVLAMCVAIALAVAVVVNWPVHDEKRLNAMAWMNVGVTLAEEGDLVAATEYLHRAVQGHPESAEANNNLAQALALQGDYASAIGHYQAALALEPGLSGVDYNLAVALERVGRAAEAVRHYERALESNPLDEEARRALVRLEGHRP